MDSDDRKERAKRQIFLPAAPADSLVFPIPITGGRIITIHNLPYELSKSDAEKISAVVKALAVPEIKEYGK